MGPALRPTPLSPACGPRRTLNAWRLSHAVVRLRCYVARRSRRCRFRQGTDEIRRSLPAIRRFRDRSFSQALQLVRQCGASPLHRSRPASPACRLCAFAVSTAWKSRQPQGAILASFLHRAAFHCRVECGSKISSSFRVLPRPFEEPIPALDVWRMPVGPESGNGGRRDLSTFGKNASGQGWITQPLAARFGGYPRSRLASSRKRSALSLMKPSASCWS